MVYYQERWASSIICQVVQCPHLISRHLPLLLLARVFYHVCHRYKINTGPTVCLSEIRRYYYRFRQVAYHQVVPNISNEIPSPCVHRRSCRLLPIHLARLLNSNTARNDDSILGSRVQGSASMRQARGFLRWKLLGMHTCPKIRIIPLGQPVT